MAGDNEKIGGRRKKSANRTNLNPLKDKGFKKRCKKSKKILKKSTLNAKKLQKNFPIPSNPYPITPERLRRRAEAE